MECKKCINYFEVSFEDYFDAPYCKIGVNIGKDILVIKCPHYKPKVDNKVIKNKIKEEQKHKNRIKRQRARFNNKQR